MATFRQLSQILSLVAYWRKHPIAKQDVNGTVLRFLRWQIGSRLLGKPVLVPWVNNTVLIVETGMTGATMNIYCGLHEAADMGFVLHFLRPNDTFLDVGANVGSYTILASGAVGASSITIEPVPSTHTRLLQNIRLNNLADLVTPHATAVGRELGTVSFISSLDTMNRVAVSSDNSPIIEVPLSTLDHILLDTDPPILWKVDVEGYEDAVLGGAVASLSSEHLKAVLLEADTPHLQDVMKACGFLQYCYDPLKRSLREGSSKTDGGHNQLWIRDYDFVVARVSTSPQYEILNVRI
jgi:FkbM family methyltransferase